MSAGDVSETSESEKRTSFQFERPILNEKIQVESNESDKEQESTHILVAAQQESRLIRKFCNKLLASQAASSQFTGYKFKNRIHFDVMVCRRGTPAFCVNLM